jgi:hypothetical protein
MFIESHLGNVAIRDDLVDAGRVDSMFIEQDNRGP